MNLIASMEMSHDTRAAECEIHGLFESVKISSTWFGCPECASIAEEAERAVERAKQAEKERQRAFSALRATGIPPRFHQATLGCYSVKAGNEPQARAKAFVKHYAENFDVDGAQGKCAVFLGGVGTGKTHLACGVLLHLFEAGKRNVRYVTVQALVQRVKATFGNNADETEQKALAGYIDAALLVLDEVGVQSGTDFERNTIYSVLNARYESNRPTIIVSNLNVEELTDVLGERVVDRLRDDGGQLIPFNWESHRRG